MKLENGRFYRISNVSEPILGVSYRLSADITCITAVSAAAVNWSHDTADQRTFTPRHRHAWTRIRERVGGTGGGRL